MRFLDADLKPVTARDALSPLLMAASITAVAALMGLLGGHGAWLGLQAFPAVFAGSLMAQAGISPQRSPMATLAALPLLWLIFVAGARLAA